MYVKLANIIKKVNKTTSQQDNKFFLIMNYEL